MVDRFVADDNVGELGVGGLGWAFVVHLVERGEVGRCCVATVGDSAVFDARAEPCTCSDLSTTA
eukprot:6312176-Ditylum_brightwellii.AAC.1